MSVPAPPQLHIDVLIFGGGIAGLWTLARLRKEGYSCLLLESSALGSGQTIASQGIIHGGIKYALMGQASAASKAIAEMPAIWRACLRGEGEIDLRGVKVLSERQYLWTTPGIGSRIAGVAASKVIRTAVARVPPNQRPEWFRGASAGVDVYSVEEPVLDPKSLVASLVTADAPIVLVPNEEEAIPEADAKSVLIRAGDGRSVRVFAKRIVLAAGERNGRLAVLLLTGEEGRMPPRRAVAQQLRPLHMVMARGNLPAIFGHCVGLSDKPHLTISSQHDPAGSTTWYIGGQIAESGVDRSPASQIKHAKQEVHSALPWINHSDARWSTLRITRAEGTANSPIVRPNEPVIEPMSHVLRVYPIKLAFAPLLAARIVERVRADGIEPTRADLGAVRDWPRPQVAPLPWDREDLTWT